MTTTQQPSTKQASTKQDILHHLLKQGQCTVQALAERLQVSPQAVRRHLKDLETDGLIVHQVVQARMGRPNYTYVLSLAGRDRFPDRSDKFAISLLDTLAATVSKEQMKSILQKQWERKAVEYRDRIGCGLLKDRVSKLAEIRQAEGYMTECHSIDADGAMADGNRFVLTEHHCAISQIAESFPSVCGHELNMFEIALQGCRVQRTHWQANGEHRCGYLIQSK